MIIFQISRAKKLIELFKQLKRRQNAVLARHNELHPDLFGRGYELAEYNATWHEYCNLRDKLRFVKFEYKQLR